MPHTFGRAFPLMNMSVCELAGLSPAPAVIADNKDQYAIVNASNGDEMERMLRSLTTSMGASAAVCTYPMTGKQAKKIAIKGTLSLALEMGKAFLEARDSGKLVPSFFHGGKENTCSTAASSTLSLPWRARF